MTEKDKERLGNNIRALRTAFGGNQEDLARLITIPQTSISYYENGKRDIPLENLDKIAKHYFVTVQELLYSDLSGYNLHIDEKSINIALNQYDAIFCVFWKEEALSNQNFLNAYTQHKLFYNSLKKSIMLHISETNETYNEYLEKNSDEEASIKTPVDFILQLGKQFSYCFDEYIKAFEDNNKIVKKFSAINYIIMYHYIVGAKCCIPFINESKEITNQLCDIMSFDNNDFNSFIPVLNCLSDIWNNVQYKKMLKRMMKTLKNWDSDLFYYYQALEFVHNINDSANDLTVNVRKGYDMLNQISSYGNIYAKRYLEICPEPTK